jgi:mRNA interferase MazF
MKKYMPDRGDFISVTFDPQSGHEQKGRRPALVVSSRLFNERTGLAIVCPVTNTDRHWPLHVRLPENCVLSGVVMVEQVKSIDYVSRRAQFIDKAPEEIFNEVLAILDACIFDGNN